MRDSPANRRDGNGEPGRYGFLALESRKPYRADFDAEDLGKTVYFALRW